MMCIAHLSFLSIMHIDQHHRVPGKEKRCFPSLGSIFIWKLGLQIGLADYLADGRTRIMARMAE